MGQNSDLVGQELVCNSLIRLFWLDRIEPEPSHMSTCQGIDSAMAVPARQPDRSISSTGVAAVAANGKPPRCERCPYPCTCRCCSVSWSHGWNHTQQRGNPAALAGEESRHGSAEAEKERPDPLTRCSFVHRSSYHLLATAVAPNAILMNC